MFIELLFIMLLGISLSFDSFAVGFSYGIKGIHTPFTSLLTIGFFTGAVFFVSMLFGQGISQYISAESTSLIGGLILICLGSIAVINAAIKKEKNLSARAVVPLEGTAINKRKIIRILNIKIVIEILKNPEKADVNQSGRISFKESFMLGIALSLDASGVGIGAGFQEYPLILTPIIIAIISGIFLTVGTNLGQRFSNIKWVCKIQFLPGCLLLLLGLLKILS
ncbi:sporulation membrane protein YtaF [Peribacillus deserti]|nr:sporulation membrane protein YtaF [Peribacillus deserti]